MTALRTHYKYVLDLTGQDQTIEMPKGTQIVHVAVQNGLPCMWAVVDVDPEAEPVERTFTLLATGQHFDAAHWMRWGTVLLNDGALVFQVAERRPESKKPKGRCPFCNEAGAPSTVRSESTEYESTEYPDTYYDEGGQDHSHDGSVHLTVYACSLGHRWRERYQAPCHAMACPAKGIDETTRLEDAT